MLEARVIEKARESADLSPGQLAQLLGVEPHELGAPSSEVLADCARFLGVALPELFRSKTGPTAPMYRTIGGRKPTLDALAHEGAGLTIGGFVRDLRLAAELEGTAAQPPAWATYRRIPDGSQTPHDADVLADMVREKCELGARPIPSIWQLASQLGVRCAAVSPDELSGAISGLSWRRDPQPMLIANLVGGASAWWGTRMTVAHELCHVLFDLPQMGLILSGDRQGRFFELYEAVEQRANAFAAYLLLPKAAVRAVVGGRSPLDVGIVRELSATYGVSTLVAANVVRYTHNLSTHQRNALLQEIHLDNVLPPTHPDAIVPPCPHAQLQRAVQHGVETAQLDAVSARSMLGLRMSDALPFGPPNVRGPLLGLSQRIRGIVTRHLHETGRTHLACTGETTLLPDDHYEVELKDALTGEDTGERVQLTADLRIA